MQPGDFDVAALQQALLGGEAEEGAVATFTGYVRDQRADKSLQALELEHYPGMTEASIGAIIEQARQRWPIHAATVVHRVGRLQPGERIVWVGVASGHRAAAFEACEFIMDYLKTRAPFWKKEHALEGAAWVEARDSDVRRARRWSRGEEP
ncbi:MAG: molybdopterin synthase catalytic subunit MoaE [Halioglobus sp.]